METLLKSCIKHSLFDGHVPDVNTDALQALKSDPAVLDVQVAAIATDRGAVAGDRVNTTQSEGRSRSLNFEMMLMHQQAALRSLSPSQLELLMKFTEILRQQRQNIQKQLECAFCKNNGESASWYSTHSLKDSRGRVRCPVLRGIRCSLCGAFGDRAHTIKYCPKNNLADYETHVSSASSVRNSAKFRDLTMPKH